MNFDNIAQLTQLVEQDISREVLIEKYAKGDETTVEQVRQRVATASRRDRRSGRGSSQRAAADRLLPLDPGQGP